MAEKDASPAKRNVNNFRDLFLILRDKDLFAHGPRQQDVDLGDAASLRYAITAASVELPGLYQDAYVAPLLRNIEQTRVRCSKATMETLAGAVYCHKHQNKEVRDAVRGLLAVVSNVYRSFLTPEFGIKKPLPQPKVTIPSLVMFRPRLYLDDQEYTPFVMPSKEVQRLCGGSVGVITIPSNYRKQSVLCWGIIAHEAGGHDVLNAYEGLLWEMKNLVLRHFYKGKDPKGDALESEDQFLGFLWQYWIEEAACDVCAILNLGPAYAKGVAVYLAALNERIRRWKQEKLDVPSEPGDKPFLTTSWPPTTADDTESINSHPTDILKLNVMIGAIHELRALDQEYKDQFIKEIEELIAYALSVSDQDNRTIQIRGWIQFKPGRWVRVKDNDFPVKREDMERHAREIGQLIAKQSFQTLNGNGLQDLETWDTSDQLVADDVCSLMLDDQIRFCQGDEAQLIAGAILALSKNPDRTFYDSLNQGLSDLLLDGFKDDPIWGIETYHPIN